VVFESIFLPSGTIETTRALFHNIKASYYQWDNPLTIVRIILEGAFLCILCLYTFLELNTILHVIYKKFDNQRKVEASND
jgi:hypothetical protein